MLKKRGISFHSAVKESVITPSLNPPYPLKSINARFRGWVQGGGGFVQLSRGTGTFPEKIIKQMPRV